ncbi:MAG: hypothetical protein IT331_13435 [Anaerolineae bacterium]|nr:hypothetical protein [Anaerolineae bacterium]
MQTSAPLTTTPVVTTFVASSSSPTLENSIQERRVIALLDTYPTLSLPIATAMVQRAAQEPTGTILAHLEQALDQFDTLPGIAELSGSQIRVLDVALRQVNARVSQLQSQLRLAWGND